MKNKKAFWLWTCAGLLWWIGAVVHGVGENLPMLAMYFSVGAMNLAVGRMYA